MPEVSRIDLLRKVRADERFKSLPFVLITAEKDHKQVVTAINEGVTDYLIKPFTTESLQKKLEGTHRKVIGD